MQRVLLLLLLCSALGPTAAAQAVLYAGLIKTKGYVVGSPLSASGLHRYEGDTTWVHVGWNHPRISGISYDPEDPGVLFLAAGNGALRTLDGGRSWRITTGWEVTEAQDVAVDPAAPDHVYVATAYGVWRTADRGATWSEANDGIPAPERYTQTIEVDRTQAGRVLAGTWGGLYASSDGARSWSRVAAPGVPVLDLQQSASAPGVWLAGTQEHGVLRSADGGRTWRRAAGQIAEETVHAVAIDPYDPQRMAAAGWDTGVYVSTDGGRSWRQRKGSLPVPHFYEVVFDANRPGRLWAATVEEGIYYSDDLGRGWHYAGLDGTLVFDMIFIEPKAP